MLGPALPIARTTFIEAVRQPIFFILVLLGGLGIMIATASAGYSMGFTEAGEVSGDNKVLLELGMATVFLCGTLLAGFVATSAMSREIENKTVLTIVSKPVPRPVVVLGKYAGVTGAVCLGVVTMIVFLFMALRHKVMSTAADEIDGPVVTAAFGALFISMAAGVWGNFFYGWSFAQTVALCLCPLSIVGYGLVLLVNKKWEIQGPGTDFPPQIALACLCLLCSMPVLCAIAIAASTRLGQVMTIVVCFGVFVLGLLTTALLGRHIHTNEPLSRIGEAAATEVMYDRFDQPGQVYRVMLMTPPVRRLAPGDSFYYGPNPNGAQMAVPAFTNSFAAGAGGPRLDIAELSRDKVLAAEPAIVVQSVDATGTDLTIKHIGSEPLAIARPPRAGDYVFSRPSRVNTVALVTWGVLPNLQFFWLLDGVSQNQPIPVTHVALVVLYSLAQVTVFLSAAVMLFQRRDVG